MKIWIDTKTGTWGDQSDLRLLELPEDELVFLDGMSDSELIEFGLKFGARND